MFRLRMGCLVLGYDANDIQVREDINGVERYCDCTCL